MLLRPSVAALFLGLVVSAAQAQDTGLTISPLPVGTDLQTKVPDSKDQKKTSLKIKAALTGNSMEDDYVNSKYAGGRISIEGDRKFGEYFSAKLSVGFLMATGTYTNQFSDFGGAPNFMYLDEAFVTFEPSPLFKLDAGVIPTEFSSLPSTFDASGFPSLRESTEVKGDLGKVSAFAMQSIPTSDKRTVQPTESGLTTTLMTYGVGYDANPDEKAGLLFQAGVTRFQFNNLNSSAAKDSQYLGNDVEGSGDQMRFKYDFAGYEYGAGMGLKTDSEWEFRLSGAMLRNELAPDESNLGYTYGPLVRVPVRGVELSFSGGYFYNESDTLPAAYTPTSRGSNNRFGQRAKIGFKDKQENISGYIQYTRANEIENRPNTADRETLVLNLEMTYEIL